MKLQTILEQFDTGLLDQIAADKVDDTITLRLPRPVIIQEIISALSSQSYISGKILFSRPPTYAILNTILQSPDSSIHVQGLTAKVLNYVKELSGIAAKHGQSLEKNYSLYIKILKKAWENDSLVDKSEAHILEVVKQELGIWDREHFTLMHDEQILHLWDLGQEFLLSRNALLSSGIVMAVEDKYVIAEEVEAQIRKAFGIEIKDESYKRLLNCLTKEDLSTSLAYYKLNVSGAKEQLIDRLLHCLVPPTEVLNAIHLESLRDLCRRVEILSSGQKGIVISNIIAYFDQGKDLVKQFIEEPKSEEPIQPELREMDSAIYIRVMMNLTGQQLYDILYQSSLATSGSKEDKVKRIVDSPWSERTMLNHLRKEDLAQFCRKFNMPVSGSKPELVDRMLDFIPPILSIETQLEPAKSSENSTTFTPAQISQEVLNSSEPQPLPVNFKETQMLFQNLDQDEQVVISVLKEAKSITETELDRVIVKYKLNWFLTKAHMAELMAKLRRDRKPYIQIKSVNNNNIYQWISNEGVDALLIEKKSARDIVDALRHGVVPKSNLDLLMVGQQQARDHLSEILMELTPQKSHFKFIRGQYGSGKTFLCSWLKEISLANEFAVSFINISHDQPLSDLALFFSGLISGLRTQEKTDSSALVDILESWLLNVHNKTAKIENIDITKSYSKKTLAQAVEKSIDVELANLNDIEPGFAQALRAFYEGKINGDLEIVSNAIAWITGSRSLSAQALRQIGVKGYLESNTVFPRIRAILEILNGARYKGLLLLVDELELIRKFPHARQREQALETLRLIIDEVGKNALPGCLVIFTGTDEFFEDPRYGLKSYEALAERVMTPFTNSNLVSMRQPIISLESLNSERLANVIFKIRDLYGLAYSWNAGEFAPDDSIQQLIHQWTIFGEENIDRKPRPILREFIQLLDLCEENKGVSLSQFLKNKELILSDN